MQINKPEKVRLNRYLAACGICSRREADRLIEEKRVTVNGNVATVGEQVFETDEILVNRKPVKGRNQKVVLAYYKPVGVTCTEKDKHADKTITDMVKYPVRVTYAGRLDKDSEGLLLLTNDGDLIARMMKGSHGHEKEYIVKVNREITQDFLCHMQEGVFLKELNITTRKCQIETIGKYTCRIILTQGVNRQIRRMSKELGYQVLSIKRIRVLNVQLADLQEGKIREIKGAELQTLYGMCGLQLN